MRVLIFGAGVIGRVYAARFLTAGHDVFILARRPAPEELRRTGITLRQAGKTTRAAFPTVIETAEEAAVDIAFLTIRRDHIESALPQLDALQARIVASMINAPRDLERIADAVGRDRFVPAFPGVAGRIEQDRAVSYLEIAQQPTMVGVGTVGDKEGPPADVLELLHSAGFATATVQNMRGWLQTHAVFISAFESAIVAAGGDAAVLASRRVDVRALVRAVREGLTALEARGVRTTPEALRVIFLKMPVWFAASYWSRQLRGELGHLGLAPHANASAKTELPQLQADVLTQLAGAEIPHLVRIFAASAQR